MDRKRLKKMFVTEDFYNFVRKKKGENPDKFKTNYDVQEHLIGKEIKCKNNKRRGTFWGKI